MTDNNLNFYKFLFRKFLYRLLDGIQTSALNSTKLNGQEYCWQKSLSFGNLSKYLRNESFLRPYAVPAVARLCV